MTKTVAEAAEAIARGMGTSEDAEIVTAHNARPAPREPAHDARHVLATIIREELQKRWAGTSCRFHHTETTSGCPVLEVHTFGVSFNVTITKARKPAER